MCFGPMNNQLDFGKDPCYNPDPGPEFSIFDPDLTDLHNNCTRGVFRAILGMIRITIINFGRGLQSLTHCLFYYSINHSLTHSPTHPTHSLHPLVIWSVINRDSERWHVWRNRGRIYNFYVNLYPPQLLMVISNVYVIEILNYIFILICMNSIWRPMDTTYPMFHHSFSFKETDFFNLCKWR